MSHTMFCGLPVSKDPDIKNTWLVTGPCHEGYLALRKDLDAYRWTSYPQDGRPVAMIDPCLVEGIMLDGHAMGAPQGFWCQHKKGGTLQSFLAVAGRIPDVTGMLSEGASLRELLHSPDPSLGACASIYFDVTRPDALLIAETDAGFYWFQGNGRHRVAAARILGHHIPAAMLGRMALDRRRP